MPQNDVRPSAPELTDLQLKCLDGFWNRKPAKQIAAELDISEGWVHKNLMAVRRQLHVSSSADAAAIVFGAKPGSIKNYYYQETAVSRAGVAADDSPASDNHEKLEGAIGERLLINRYGPLATIAGIVLVAVGSIIGVTLMIDAAQGMYQLWKALGY